MFDQFGWCLECWLWTGAGVIFSLPTELFFAVMFLLFPCFGLLLVFILLAVRRSKAHVFWFLQAVLSL